MSKHEDWMIESYWKHVGGTIIKEFQVYSKSATSGTRFLDAVILPRHKTRQAKFKDVNIKGEDVIVVQAKARRLGMSLMGQALFSAELIQRFSPSSVCSVALCLGDDSVLRPLLKRYKNMYVVVVSPDGKLKEL